MAQPVPRIDGQTGIAPGLDADGQIKTFVGQGIARGQANGNAVLIDKDARSAQLFCGLQKLPCGVGADQPAGSGAVSAGDPGIQNAPGIPQRLGGQGAAGNPRCVLYPVQRIAVMAEFLALQGKLPGNVVEVFVIGRGPAEFKDAGEGTARKCGGGAAHIAQLGRGTAGEFLQKPLHRMVRAAGEEPGVLPPPAGVYGKQVGFQQDRKLHLVAPQIERRKMQRRSLRAVTQIQRFYGRLKRPIQRLQFHRELSSRGTSITPPVT